MAFIQPIDPLEPPVSDDFHWTPASVDYVGRLEGGLRLDAKFRALNAQPEWGRELALSTGAIATISWHPG